MPAHTHNAYMPNKAQLTFDFLPPDEPLALLRGLFASASLTAIVVLSPHVVHSYEWSRTQRPPWARANASKSSKRHMMALHGRVIHQSSANRRWHAHVASPVRPCLGVLVDLFVSIPSHARMLRQGPWPNRQRAVRIEVGKPRKHADAHVLHIPPPTNGLRQHGGLRGERAAVDACRHAGGGRKIQGVGISGLARRE